MMAPRTVLINVREVIIFSSVLATVLTTVESEKTLVLESPNYPNRYPNMYKGIFKLEVPIDHGMDIVFNDLDVEKSSSCTYDYVALFEGPTEKHPLLGRFCGKEIPRYIKATIPGIILLVFKTDGSRVAKGFRVTCTTKLLVLESPNYPNKYPHNYKETFKLQVPVGYSMELVFNDFELESGGSSCYKDYVAVFDGPTENSRLLGKFCGRAIPRPIKLTKPGMNLLVFRTDSLYAYKGFRVRCKTTSNSNLEAVVPNETKTNLTQYFLNTLRQQNHATNKWGIDVTRSAVALFLTDARFFAAGNETGEEITYELTLQLMSKLVLKKRISTKDLALFVNAMTVACINPKQFFGLDIVAELRRRIDNNNRTNPFFLLALCTGGGNMTTEDARKLQQLFRTHLQPSSTETQAMVVMALKCISRQSGIKMNVFLEQMMSKLKTKQQNSGSIEDLKTTALVIQALIATKSYETNFNMSLAIKSILNDMNHTQLSVEEMYYILPMFKMKTLLDINSSYCENLTKTDLEQITNLPREQPDERLQVQISIIIGDDMDFTRTWRIKVPSNFSCYDVINNISSSNTHYKVQYTILEEKPYIVRLGNHQNSIEDGLFWFIYTKPLTSNDDLILVEKSPVDIRVRKTAELILWYSSGPSPSTQEISEVSTDAPSVVTIDAPSTGASSTTARAQLSPTKWT